ncbi:lactate utilization protein C [candidate division KSB1 bacterium]
MTVPGAVNAKHSILARISNAKSRANLPELTEVPCMKEDRSDYEESELVKRFTEELNILGVETFIEPHKENVRTRLQSIINGSTLLSWNAECLPFDLGGLLDNEKVVYGNAEKELQAEAEIGLTGCDAAIAETGSLVLLSGSGKPKTASLLPYSHVAVVEKSRILFSLGEYFARNSRAVRQSTHLNIITGPSRTADIELTLTLGVHGPGKMIVIIGP